MSQEQGVQKGRDGPHDDPVGVAAALVDDLAPGCLGAVLAGSTVTGGATATSDLDVVVIHPGPQAAHKRALRYRGWPVELFAFTPDSCRAGIQADARARHGITAKMLAGGVVLRDGPELAALRAVAADVLARGPVPLQADELAARRYRLTNLLDDLLGAPPGAQAFLVAADLAQRAVELVLLRRGRWTGVGKWAGRLLAEAEPERADELDAAVTALAVGDRGPMAAFAEGVLALDGGRLFEGHRESLEEPGGHHDRGVRGAEPVGTGRQTEVQPVPIVVRKLQAGHRGDHDLAALLVGEYLEATTLEIGLDPVAEPARSGNARFLAGTLDPSAPWWSGGGAVLAAEEAGILLVRFGDEAELKRLWVRPDRRRTRVGHHLVAAAVALVSRHGARRLVLDVMALRTGAIALYRSLGFCEVGRRDGPPCAMVDLAFELGAPAATLGGGGDR